MNKLTEDQMKQVEALISQIEQIAGNAPPALTPQQQELANLIGEDRYRARMAEIEAMRRPRQRDLKDNKTNE